MNQTPRYVIPITWSRSMCPPNGVQMETFTLSDMPTLLIYRRPMWHYAALALAAGLVSASIGWVAGAHVKQTTVIAQPVCNRAVDENCP